MIIEWDTFRKNPKCGLNPGDKIVCEEAHLTGERPVFSVGKAYMVSDIFEGSIIVVNDLGEDWALEQGDVFSTILSKITSGDLVTCIDSTGTPLNGSKIYKVVSVLPKTIKVEGNNIKWKINRFKKFETKNKPKLKCVKDCVKYPNQLIIGNMYNLTNWHESDDYFQIQSVDKSFKNVYPKKEFHQIFELVETKAKIRKKPIKLNANKMHNHNCLKCKKQIFPKTMCHCINNFEVPF